MTLPNYKEETMISISAENAKLRKEIIEMSSYITLLENLFQEMYKEFIHRKAIDK